MSRFGLAIGVAMIATTSAHAAGTWRALGLYPTQGGGAQTTAAPLPMVESKIELVVRGPLVEAVVTQVFVNRSETATEATYIFPLPPDAAVSAMEMTIGTTTIRAAIEKRGEAQRRYEDAVRRGVMAATLEQERSDVFTQTIAAIPAKGRVEVRLRFDATALLANGTWSLALPLVVAPRFVPGTASGRGTTGSGRSPDTDRAPDASRISPGASPGAGGATTISLAFVDPVTGVSSTTHDLRGSGPYTLVDPLTDHDAVIRWRAQAPASGWIEPTKDGGYAAVVVQAPGAATTRPASRALFVLDRAATMKGDAQIAAQPFVRAWLRALRKDDRVAVTGGARAGWASPSDALSTVELAWRDARQPFDLSRVLATATPDGAPLVLVSDGLVADDAAVLAAAKKLGVPVHVVGVGAAPARGLLVRIAAVTGGTVRFVQPMDDVAAIAAGLAYDVAVAPAPLAVNWGTLAVTDVVPAQLPRLGAGQAVLVVAKIKRAHTANVRARGELFAIDALPAPRNVAGAVTSAGPLARRWAKLRLDDLLIGRDDVAAITAHALAYGLVSPYTSLVALGTSVVVQGGVRHSVAVPVSVPAGMHWDDVRQETTPPTRSEEAKAESAEPLEAKKKQAEKFSVTDSAVPRAPEPSDDAEADEEESEVARVQTAGAMSAEVQLTAAQIERGFRLSALVGGGVATRSGASAPLFSLGLRLDIGRENLVGVEAALVGIVDDDVITQGRFLLGYTRLGVGARWLEFGAGLGGQVGGGAGPAWSIAVRARASATISGFLRYDGARLYDGDRATSQHGATLGIEVGF